MSSRSNARTSPLEPARRLCALAALATLAALGSLAFAGCGQSAPAKEHAAAATSYARDGEAPPDRPRTPGPVASGSTGIAECDLFLEKLEACSPGEADAIAHLRETYRDAHAAGVDAQMVPACRQGLEKAEEACVEASASAPAAPAPGGSAAPGASSAATLSAPSAPRR
jgi:hypothetical protein